MNRRALNDEPSPMTPSLVHEPPLRAWPSEERPRERLELLGVSQLADAELLAMILRTGGVGASALTLARKLQNLAVARGGFRHLQAADSVAESSA